MKGKKKGKLHSFKHVTKTEKHNSAGVTGYISRTSVTKKLQVSIHQFRQLCILKGIHPVEPGLKRIRSQRSRTWFYLKDVNFMRRDEIMNWFINMKIYKKKKKYLKTMKKTAELAMLKQNKPKLNMDHFVRERYPTLQDAVNDLDDGLSLMSLFVEMQYGVAAKVMGKKLFQECIRLKSEWLAFVAETHALRKVFVSIKGIYYQADVLGAPVTWLVPHPQRIKVPKTVDVLTMSFFVQFYTTALNFVFYRLYTDQGYKYPPTIDRTLMGEGQVVKAIKVEKITAAAHVLKNETPALPSIKTAPLTAAEKARIEIVNRSLSKIITVDENQEDSKVEVKQEPKEEDEGEKIPKEFQDVDEREGENKEQYIRKSMLFSGFKFFINREIPNSELRFMIRAFGGEEFTEYDFPETNPTITHQIVDRDCSHMKLLPSREYIQPQWIFDSINAGILLPVHEYAHDATLPPHISPFVNDALKGYIPAQREHMDELIAQEGKVKAISDRSEKDEEEGDNPYIGENADDEDLESIEAQYARELAAEQQGRSYAGYVQDALGTTELADDDDDDDDEEDAAADDDSDEEMVAALKKKVPTKKEKREEAMKKDEEDRERMAIDLLNRKTRTKIRNIKKRVAGAKERNDALVEKRAAIEKRKKKEAQQARKALPQEPTNSGKRKEEGEGENKPAKKIKK